jgi:hypothetical protein
MTAVYEEAYKKPTIRCINKECPNFDIRLELPLKLIPLYPRCGLFH